MNLLKCVLTIFISTLTFAQTTYEVEPGLKGNLFELGFTNTGSNTEQSITVVLKNKPDWVSFTKEKVVLEKISQGEKKFSKFYFDVSENAPLGVEGTIVFNISKGNSGSFSKIYNVKVTAPSVFELNQNYPNPFNPSTQIDFNLAVDSKVSLYVYNLLGEKVTTLMNSNLAAGSHQITFNAANLNSGVYFYKLEAIGNGFDFVEVKKMILTK